MWPDGFAATREDREAVLVLSVLRTSTPRSLIALASEVGSAAAVLAALREGRAGSEGDRAIARSSDPVALAAAVAACGARAVVVGIARLSATARGHPRSARGALRRWRSDPGGARRRCDRRRPPVHPARAGADRCGRSGARAGRRHRRERGGQGDRLGRPRGRAGGRRLHPGRTRMRRGRRLPEGEPPPARAHPIGTGRSSASSRPGRRRCNGTSPRGTGSWPACAPLRSSSRAPREAGP